MVYIAVQGPGIVGREDHGCFSAVYKHEWCIFDNHLKSIGKPATSSTTAAGKSFLDKHLNSIDTKEKTTPELKPLSAPDTGKYERLRSTWLDTHLKSYDKDASARADANINYSVALDISV